jgi:hypothetical protein
VSIVSRTALTLDRLGMLERQSMNATDRLGRTDLAPRPTALAGAVLAAAFVTSGVTLGACPPPATDGYTQVTISGQVGADLPTAAPQCNVGASSTNDYTFAANELLTSPGSMHGVGAASFDTLRATSELTGPSGLRVLTQVSSHEVFTIGKANPSPGETGLMRMFYRPSGGATVRDGDDAPVFDDTSFATASSRVLLDGDEVAAASWELSEAPTGSLPGYPTVLIPFTYGVPFEILVGLGVRATTDNAFIQFTNGFSKYGGGRIQYVKVDFGGTLALDVIELPIGATLSAQSGFDYGDFVTFVDGVTTTTLVGSSTTTTTLPGGGCIREATHVSILCRVDALTADATATAELETLRAKLLRQLTVAREKLVQAGQAIQEDGKRGRIRRAYKRAGAKLKKFARLLGGKRGRRNVPEEVRAPLIARALEAREDVTTVRGSL